MGTSAWSHLSHQNTAKRVLSGLLQAALGKWALSKVSNATEAILVKGGERKGEEQGKGKREKEGEVEKGERGRKREETQGKGEEEGEGERVGSEREEKEKD
jgi:hypothetical protein